MNLLKPGSRLRQMGLRCGALAGVAFTPNSLSGLVVTWMPALARAQGKLWQDAGKTTAATAASDPVRVLTCPFKALDWTAPSDAARPLLTSEGGVLWSGTFDGADDYMQGPAAAGTVGSADCTLAVAVRYTATTSAVRIAAWGSSSSGNPIVSVDHGTGNKARMFARDNAMAATSQTPSAADANTGSLVTLTAVRSGSANNLYFNGVFDNAGTAVSGAITTDRIAVGAWLRAAASSFWAGRLSAACVYNRALAAAEVFRLHTYLGAL